MSKNKNSIIASNLIFASAILGLIAIIVVHNLEENLKEIIIGIFSILFVVFLGCLVRVGNEKVKYAFLILLILGLLTIPLILTQILEKPFFAIINLLQTILQIVATVLLFRDNKANLGREDILDSNIEDIK